MKHIEIEFKWDANSPRAFSKARTVLNKYVASEKSRILHIKDYYLDDASSRLSSSKIALRIRNTDGCWEATQKSRTEIKRGKACRREYTLPLPGVKTLSQALGLLAQQKVWNGINVTNLSVIFYILNTRTSYLFCYQKSTLEIALDNVVICTDKHRFKMKEIEAELKKGLVKDLNQFVREFSTQTHLSFAQLSKVKTAHMLLALEKHAHCVPENMHVSSKKNN